MTSRPYIPPDRKVWRPYRLRVPLVIWDAWGMDGIRRRIENGAELDALPRSSDPLFPDLGAGVMPVRLHLPVHQVEGFHQWPWRGESPEETLERYLKLLWQIEAGGSAGPRL